MHRRYAPVLLIFGTAFVPSICCAQTLQTHRIPAVLAAEAVSEAVASCARQGYRETAVLLDADGATIAVLRGDGAGIHTLDSAHDKAYTSASFKNDTLAMANLAKGDVGALQKLPHVLFFGGGVVIKRWAMKSSVRLEQAGRRAPSWTIIVHGPAWKKFEIG